MLFSFDINCLEKDISYSVDLKHGKELPRPCIATSLVFVSSHLHVTDRITLYCTFTGKPIRHTPRLFYMNSVAGVFEAVEILNPTRSHDLVTPMPFLQSDLYKVSQPGEWVVVPNKHSQDATCDWM